MAELPTPPTERDLVVDLVPILDSILTEAKLGSGSIVLLIPQYVYPIGGSVVTIEVRRMV